MATHPTPASAATGHSDAEMSLMKRRPRRHRRLGHGALDGVDRHPHMRRQGLDHRHHPAQLLALGHRLGPGPARLAPHVHHIGPLARHVEAVGHGAASASRKRPPSENESGVTLSTPMTRGRMPVG